jgi:hypothetical protein
MEMQEKFLHHIWDQRHLIPDLKTLSGKPVKIIYQGQYNTSNGPDFKHAIIALDGENIQGDIEIHHKTYDWIAHQHHEDPAYNNTILHVVMEHKSTLNYTIREDAFPIEILEIKEQIDADIAKLFAVYQDSQFKPEKSLCDFFKLSSSSQLEPLLRAYGWERFTRKCNRFNAELLFNGFEQLLYSGFMEAMGYDKNKSNTHFLAYSFSWQKLKEWHKNGLDAITLASIWLYYSGLMDKAEKLLDTEMVKSIKQAYEYQTFTAEKGNLKWNMFRVRPANHPVKRLIQASIFVTNMLESGLLSALENAITDDANLSLKNISAILSKQFTTPDNRLDSIEKTGKTMNLTIAGNIILPIMYLYGEKTDNAGLKIKVRNLYQQFPPLQDNYILTFMKEYLSEEQAKAINGSYAFQQGLMNIYFRFCIYRLCDLCLADRNKCVSSL